jgi:hypothetical protein
MRNYCFLLFSCWLNAAALYGQLSVNVTGQHYGMLFGRTVAVPDPPFVSFYQLGAGAAWQRRAFNAYASVSLLSKKESLKETTWYTSGGSFGSGGTNTVMTASADAAVSYMGFRLGIDYVVNRGGKFQLLLGALVHLDGLLYERESNYYRTSSDPGTPPLTKPFNAIDARKTYFYYGVRLRPRYYFTKCVYAELQLGLNFYSNRRIFNHVFSYSSEDYPYYDSGWMHQYISNELGIGLGYVLRKRMKTPKSPPGGAW